MVNIAFEGVLWPQRLIAFATGYYFIFLFYMVIYE